MSEVKNTQEKVMEGFSNVDTKMNEVKASTVVPLYTAPLTSCHPSYAATKQRQGQFSLFIYLSPMATPLTRPAATILRHQTANKPLHRGEIYCKILNIIQFQGMTYNQRLLINWYNVTWGQSTVANGPAIN